MSTPTAPKPMTRARLDSVRSAAASNHGPRTFPRGVVRELLADRDSLAAEVERLRRCIDGLARELVPDLTRRGAECARHACAHADAGLTVDAGRCIGQKDAYVRAAGLLASALRVSPRASEGAATPRVPHGGPASMWPQVREHAAENGDDPTLCECGNLGECIGQFEGETRPALGCPGCCKHDDMGAGGRCWPIVWGAATPTLPEHECRVHLEATRAGDRCSKGTPGCIIRSEP